MSENIEIYASKKKTLLLILGSIFFVTVSSLMIAGIIGDNIVYQTIGIVGCTFFGLTTFAGTKKLFKKTPEIIIDQSGINLNPTNDTRRISWSEVAGFSTIEIQHTKLIAIHIKDPEHWLLNEKGKWKRKTMSFNYNNYGTPFCISSNYLKTSHSELLQLLQSSYLRHCK